MEARRCASEESRGVDFNEKITGCVLANDSEEHASLARGPAHLMRIVATAARAAWPLCSRLSFTVLATGYRAATCRPSRHGLHV